MLDSNLTIILARLEITQGWWQGGIRRQPDRNLIISDITIGII